MAERLKRNTGTHLSAIHFDVSAQCYGCQGSSHDTSENGRDNESNEDPDNGKNTSYKSTRSSIAITVRKRDSRELLFTWPTPFQEKIP